MNEVSTSRLRDFKTFMGGLRRVRPDIEGVVVFGSQTLGRAREESDIDSYIFIKPPSDKDDARMSHTKGYRNWETTNSEFRSIFQGALPETIAKGLRVRLISDARILNELEAALDYERRPDDRKREREPFLDFGLIFHLEIGQGLKHYRDLVLDKLSEEGDDGDMVWRKHVVSRIRFNENSRLVGVNRTRNRLFPETTQEARAKFI